MIRGRAARGGLASLCAVLVGAALGTGAAGADPTGLDAVPEVAGGPPVGSAKQPVGLNAAPPAGWTAMPGLARSVATALEQSHTFGALRGRAGARAWAMPGTGAFYLSWLVAQRTASSPEVAVRGAFDRLREARVAASPQARSTEEISYSDRVDGGVAEAHLEWRHLSNETMSLVRALAWVSPDGVPTLANAECVIGAPGGKAPPQVVATCRTALASLSLSLPASKRGALTALAPSAAPQEDRFAAMDPEGAVPGGSATGPDGAAEQGQGGQGGSDQAGGQATLGAVPSGAEGHVLYRGPGPRQRSRGISGWLIGIGVGILLIAALVSIRSRVRRDIAREPDAEPEADADADADAGADADADAEVAADADADPDADADADADAEDDDGDAEQVAGAPDPSDDAGEDDKNA